LDELSAAALVKVRSGDYDMALEIAQILAALFPKHRSATAQAILHLKTVILQERAKTIEQLGKSELGKAAKHEALLAEKRENANSFYTEVSTLIEKGAGEEALAKIRDKIEKRPKSWNLWFLLGWTLRSLKRWEEGAAALKKSLELGGERMDARNELAICLMEEGKFREAERELEKAFFAEPFNTKIISNLGVLSLRQGKKDEAERFFRTVLEFDEHDPLALHYFKTAGQG
jgi:Flp pilus assembly protein TadD